jgi:hypothetical protein
MKNTVEVYTEFDYQGVTLKPTMTLDLDAHIQSLEDIAAIPVLLARANQIDSYSYQYEVLLDSQLSYSHAQGLATEFLRDGEFDFAGFLAVHGMDNVMCKLQKIAQDTLGISELSAHQQLQQALLQAYQLDR